MSFPFLQPYAGLSNSLQTAQAAGGAGGVGGWVELARTTVGTTGDPLDVSSLSDKRYYMVLLDHQASGSSQPNGRFNSDSGSNYAYRFENDGSGGSGVNKSNMKTANGWNTSEYGVWYISNLAAREKLSYYACTTDRGSGAGTAPSRSMTANKWTNTSNAINAINFQQGGGGGNFAAGSECVVLGYDPDDTHTTNFWEELASVELGSAGDELSTGSFTGKRYLWVQVFTINSGATNAKFTYNNDTGSNYAFRYSNDGAADGTSTSDSSIQLNVANGSAFYNMFIVNVASREKFGLGDIVDQNTAGAGTAPNRSRSSFKWANTSSQITEIDVTNNAAGSYDTGSIIKVWGSD